MGPLKWHYEEAAHLSSDELRLLVEGLGFEVHHWEVQLKGESAGYLPTEHLMQDETYRCLFFVAFLPPSSDTID
jgi:hypothetical protein